MSNLFEELKRRKVFRVAAVYAVVAWLLIQVADTLLPALQMPDWTVSFVTVLCLMGFPVACVLAWAYEVSPGGIQPDNAGVQQSSPAGNQPLLYATFILVLVVAGFQVADRFVITDSTTAIETTSRSEMVQSSPMRLSIRLPDEEAFDSFRGDFDLSPNGDLFVYRGNNGGRAILTLRRLDQAGGRILRGTEGATRPKFSPDGSEVVFQTSGQIRVVSLESGGVRTLIPNGADVPDWSPDGEWVYFRNQENGISRVAARGGEPEVIVSINADNGESTFVSPTVLPGNHLVYTVRAVEQDDYLQTFNAETGQKRNLASGAYPIYSATGNLLYQNSADRTLKAAPFDSASLTFSGPAVPLADNLLLVGTGRVANVGLSDNGRLIYRTGDSTGILATPVWVDREGREAEIDSDWQILSLAGRGSPSLSPDGNRIAVSVFRDSRIASDIWVYQLEGPLSRISFDHEDVWSPVWSADGQSVLYHRNNGPGIWEIWRKNANGTGIAERLLSHGFDIRRMKMSSDGDWLVFRDLPGGNGTGRILAMNLRVEQDLITLVDTGFEVTSPDLSPDDRWLAYTSDESGQWEVYVQPFPETANGRWQVSVDGGIEPVWGKRGNELFYRNNEGELVAVTLNIQAESFAWQSHRALFSTTAYGSTNQGAIYDVSPDDQRFLMMRMDAVLDTELILVENWLELYGLEQRETSAAESSD